MKESAVAMQVQAISKKDREQIRIQMNALKVLNPLKQNARVLRAEFDRALAENASLKTAAAGNDEVRLLIQQASDAGHMSLLHAQAPTIGHQSTIQWLMLQEEMKDKMLHSV